MRRRIRLSTAVGPKALSIAVAMMLLLAVESGCSKSVPKCDDGKTVDAVINYVSADLRKDLSLLTEMGTGMPLSDEEWKAVRIGIVIDLENIREHSLDEGAEKRNCAANVMINDKGAKELIPVTYVAERNRESGSVKITLSGLDEYKQSGMEEMSSPTP